MQVRKFTNRRDFLRVTALGAASAAILAACAPSAQPTQPPAAKATEAPKPAAQPTQASAPTTAPAAVATTAPKPTAAAAAATPAAKSTVAASGQKVEIVYWHGWSGRFADWLNRVGEGFTKANPDITVKFVQYDWAQLYPKLLTAVAAGQSPDTFVAGNESGQLYSLAANEVIQPLEDVGDRNDVAALKDVVHPVIWEIGSYKGKLWALPQWTQSYEIFVNVKAAQDAGVDPEKPPATYDELDAIADKLYKRDSNGTIRRLGFDPGTWYFPWWGRFNATYTNAAGEPDLVQDQNVACIEWMASYAKRYDPKRIADFQSAVQGSDAQDPFLTGQFAMFENGPWQLGNMYEYKKDLQYKVWALPVANGVTGRGMSTGGDIPVIPKGVKNPQASFRFIRYLIGVDDPNTYVTLWSVGLRPHMPISEKVAKSDAFKKVYEMFPGFDIFVNDFFSSDRIAPPPKTPVAEFFTDRLNQNVQKAKLLQVTPKQALETTQKEVSDELKKWMDAHK